MTDKSYTYEGTRENFAALVIENSGKGPVLVNFWAEWAGPCHRLFPVLAKLAREYAGRFLLVNVNTDQEKSVAREYGVNNLPLIKIFRRGVVVEDIHGYQPEPELRRTINRHVIQASDGRIAEAVGRYQQGEVEEGLSMLAQAALDDPENLRIPVILGKLLMARGRFGEAWSLLSGLPSEARRDPDVSNLLAHVDFIRAADGAPQRAVLFARLAADSKDSAARYQLGALSLVDDDYEGALEQLLELVRRDRGFGDDAGVRGMRAVFALLGNQGPLVERYRAALYNALH